ncbi:MAG: hypothetical protein ACI4D4_01985, partial [Lachnospira sp.]
RAVNINAGHNIKLMQSCKKLQDYSTFIGYVREYSEESEDIRSAINKAIDRCINEDVLRDILVNQRAEVLEIMFTEYDMEKHMKVVRKDGYDEGFDDGYDNGRNDGFNEGHNAGFNEGHDNGFNDCLSEIITAMSKDGRTLEEISDITKVNIDVVNKFLHQ